MTDSRRIAGEVLAGIPGRAEISFAYGRGSAFTAFADAADIDMVVVWSCLPTQELRIGTGVARRFGGATYGLACVRRGDHWLFGRLTDRLVRHCYIAWFALEGFHCPFPKHLGEWVGRLGLDGDVAGLERAVWEGRSLEERDGAVERFARAVLAAG